MDNDVLGILKLRIIKGIDLAIRDSRASDPYVVVIMGDQVYISFAFKPSLFNQ